MHREDRLHQTHQRTEAKVSEAKTGTIDRTNEKCSFHFLGHTGGNENAQRLELERIKNDLVFV